jgi:hypothetical protein
MMTTPTNDSQKNCGDKSEPTAKGGVAGTDSKDFDCEDTFNQNPEPAKEAPTNPKAS